MVRALITVNCSCASSWWMIPPDPVWMSGLSTFMMTILNWKYKTVDTGFKSCTLIYECALSLSHLFNR